MLVVPRLLHRECFEASEATVTKPKIEGTGPKDR